MKFQPEDKPLILLKYFNELKLLLQKRIEVYDVAVPLHEYDSKRLLEIVKELIYIRSLLDDG